MFNLISILKALIDMHTTCISLMKVVSKFNTWIVPRKKLWKLKIAVVMDVVKDLLEDVVEEEHIKVTS